MARLRAVGVFIAATLLLTLAGSPLGAPTAHAQSWTRYEETDDNVARIGAGWTPQTNAGHSAGTASNSAITNDYAEVTCTNSSGIRWIGQTGASRGIAAVSTDGGAETNVDSYTGTTQFQEMLREVTGLAVGTHTMRVRVTGTRHALSSANTITADAFECLEAAPPPTTTTSTTTTTLPPTQEVRLTGVEIPGWYLFVAVISLAAGCKVGSTLAGRE